MQRTIRADSRRAASRGFTLIELLIVVVVIGLVASIAVPMLGQADTGRLRAAAQILVADLALAQAESLAHSDDPRVVVFDPANGRYHVAASSAPQTPLGDPISGRPLRTTFGEGRAASASGVSIQAVAAGDDNAIGFGRYGQLDQAEAATVTLEAGGFTLVVEIDPDTGEATLTGE